MDSTRNEGTKSFPPRKPLWIACSKVIDMDQFLASLPKTVIALSAMVLALFLFRQISPPVTICQAQMDLFRDSQKNFLYAPKITNGLERIARIDQVIKSCKVDNSPGGCFELFVGLKKVSVDMHNIPEQCAEEAGEEKEIKGNIWKTLKLMVQMAWGERAPASHMQKNGWYDTSEISLYCELRRHAIRFYGKDEFNRWQEEMLKGMPKSENLTREQVWPRSILSTPCDLYR